MKYLVFSIKHIFIFLSLGILNTIYQIPDTAHAEGISLKIQPTSLQIRATANADIKAPFTLTNNGSDPVEVYFILKRFSQAGENSENVEFAYPNLTDDRIKDTFLQKIQILDNGSAINTLILSPKQMKRIELGIKIDSNTPPLDHSFSVIAITVIKPSIGLEKENTTSFVQTGISLPVLLSIKTDKTSTSKIYLEDFSGPLFLLSGPVPVTVKLKNSGTHFASAKGVIIIKNIFGQAVGRIDIPTTNILAGTSRYLSSKTQSDSLSQSPNVVWNEKFLLGYYTASLSLAVPEDKILYTRSINFFAFPLITFFYIAIGIFLSFIIVKRIRKKLSE